MTFAPTVAEHLTAGDRVDVHWWFDGKPMEGSAMTSDTRRLSRIYLVGMGGGIAAGSMLHDLLGGPATAVLALSMVLVVSLLEAAARSAR